MSRLEKFPVVARPVEIDMLIRWLRNTNHDEWCARKYMVVSTRNGGVWIQHCAIGKLDQLFGYSGDVKTEEEFCAHELRSGVSRSDRGEIVRRNDTVGREAVAIWLEAKFP